MAEYSSLLLFMDEQVIAAMARWPNVPAVYGWLSLSEAGQWRLHPQGDALQQPDSPGEAITSPQILAFMGRNYAANAQGHWYFQNGPQRVYLRLDSAPYIAHTTTDTASGRLLLRTHTGLDILEVQALHLDETGRCYAATGRGPALIAGRDLPALFDALHAVPGPGKLENDIHQALAHCLETGSTVMLSSDSVLGFPQTAIPLHFSPQNTLEQRLGFCRQPQPPATSATAPEPPQGPALG